MKFLTIESTFDYQGDSLINVLFGRKANGDRIRVDVTGFRSYFYALAGEVRSQEPWLLNQDAITEVEYGFESLFGDDIAKLYLNHPSDVSKVSNLFEDTFDADVWFTDKFRIDTGLRAWAEVPESAKHSEGHYRCSVESLTALESVDLSDPEPRVMTFDIEVDDRGEGFPEPGEERVLSIVAHDSYSDKYTGFIDLHGKPVGEAFPDGRPEGVDELQFFRSEEDMLGSFIQYIAKQDPDILTGWHLRDFDAPYIIARCEALGVDAAPSSPVGITELKGDTPYIRGRAIYDTLKAYKRNSRGELDSFKLDSVAMEELGEAKLEHEEGFYEMYAENPAKMIRYNARDTRLTVEIDREAGVLDFRKALRKLVGVDWAATLEANDFIEMYARRKLKSEGLVGPTAQYEKAEGYEGGHVFDAFSGVADNVAEIDLSSLYPMTMKMLNLSPEVKTSSESEAYEAANGVYFSKEQDGIFRKLVDDVMEVSDQFKRLRRGADSREEHERFAQLYDASKAIRNALYGVLGWEYFFLYDRDTAEAITLTAQRALKAGANFVEEQGHRVLYGDTDSCYIELPEEWSHEECLGRTRTLADLINEEVYPEVVTEFGVEPEDCEWVMEVESLSARFFQAGKKKRYAKKIVADETGVLSSPEYKIVGFGSQRSDRAKLARETEEEVIRQILDGEPDSAIIDTVFSAASSIDPDDPDWAELGIPQGIGKSLDQYDRPGAHIRGAIASNKVLGTDFGKDDKPKRCYINPVVLGESGEATDVICYESPSDLRPVEDRITVDVSKMTDKVLRAPLKRILEPVDVNIDAALRGQVQRGLAAF